MQKLLGKLKNKIMSFKKFEQVITNIKTEKVFGHKKMITETIK